MAAGALQELALRVWLIVLQVPTPTPTTMPDVYPQQGNGFAAAIVPALIGVGVLALAAVWLSSSPKRRRPTPQGPDRRVGSRDHR